MLLGCIADDLTGATDLALTLQRGGMRCVQVMGVPDASVSLSAYDAVVVALKSRTIPADEAVTLSLAAAEALLSVGARQLLFKYCSTFDSTDGGNIGPVAEALLARTGGGLTIACPAFPANKRSVYMGNLFVGEAPLAESPMKDHPLTPMRDSNLVRVLQRQAKGRVGLIPFSVVDRGADAIAEAYRQAARDGHTLVIVDAITEQHLIDMGTAAASMPLITGGSGIALGLPGNFIRAGLMQAAPAIDRMNAAPGRAAIIAGSCSQATRGQVRAAIDAGIPHREVDAMAIDAGRLQAADLIDWALAQPAGKPVLIYSSADPAVVAKVQDKLGRAEAGEMVEDLLAATAQGFVRGGVTRLIVAGGETSGAVVARLGVSALEIGPEIDPGVPWTRSIAGDAHGLVLALKSGNFGAPDFFLKAWERLS